MSQIDFAVKPEYRFIVDADPDCPSLTIAVGDALQIEWAPEWAPAFEPEVAEGELPSGPLEIDAGCGNGAFTLALERGGSGWTLALEAARYGSGDGGAQRTYLHRLTDGDVRALLAALRDLAKCRPGEDDDEEPVDE